MNQSKFVNNKGESIMDEINDNSNHASNNDHKIPEERLQKPLIQ